MNSNFFQKTVTLRSGRQVLIRVPELSDAQAFVDFLKQLLEEDTFIDSEPQTLKDEKEYILSMRKKIQNGTEAHLVVFNNREKVGAVDLNYISFRKGQIRELSIFIRKDYRKDGLGKLLFQEIFSIAKDKLHISKIILNVFGTNDVAMALYKKNGFKEYGRLHNAILYKGKYVDEVLYYKEL